MYIFYGRCQIKILEKNADQITFTIGHKQSYFLKIFTLILFMLISGYFMVLILPSSITNILDGNLYLIWHLFFLFLIIALFVHTYFYKVYFSLCKFNFKTHEIDLFQESRMRKKKIKENLDNFFTFKIRDSSDENKTEYSVYLELVSKKNIYLGKMGGREEDYRTLDEIEKWIRKNK